jgi:DNA-binding CsgD family transcriptional regulator
MRVLVCEGPSLLASVGLVQPTPTTERQRDLLARVVPAFRRRLEFERFITEAKLAANALIGALEQVNGAAYVLGSAGRIAHANAAGRARFDHDPTATRTALDACVAGTNVPRFKVAPLRGAEGNAGHIVVELPEPAGGAAGLAATARQYGLTPAQARVLERVARGSSNATIAADLGVAERTIEAHVTAILIKAQVSSRAALIVQIFRQRQSA